MFCPACGASNPDDARFCASCATALTPQGQPAPAPTAAPAPQPAPVAPPAVPPRQEWAGGAQQTYQAPPAQPVDVSKFLFVPRLLEYISNGGLFRKIVAGFLIMGAVLSGLAMLAVGVILALQYFNYGGIAILGGLIAFPVAIFGGYLMVHTYLVRARSIKELGASDYTVIPIMAILLKLNGELGLIGGLMYGVQGMLLAWFLGQNPMTSLTSAYGYGYGGYSSSPAEGFILGILFLVVAVVFGFLSLLVNYLLSELVGIFADIARDVRAMRKSSAEGV